MAVEQYLEDQDAFLDDLWMHLLRAQQRMKTTADLSRRFVEFQVGDLVFLKLRPYRQKSLAARKNEKLAARFYCPFRVLARVGQVAYRLELSASAHIHPMFHVSQLQAAVGSAHSSPTIPPSLTADLEFQVEPEQLLDVRYADMPEGRQLKVVLKWKNLPLFKATWERFETICAQFPDFNLEDKIRAEGGNVRDIRYTYARRGRPNN